MQDFSFQKLKWNVVIYIAVEVIMPVKIGIVGSKEQCEWLFSLTKDQDAFWVVAALIMPDDERLRKSAGKQEFFVARTWGDFFQKSPQSVFCFDAPPTPLMEWQRQGGEVVSGEAAHALCILLGSASRRVNDSEERCAKYLSALNAVTEGIQIMNEAGVIEYVNPAFSQITGIHPSERIGANVFTVSPGGAAAKVMETGKAAIGVRNQSVGSCADVISNGAPIFINGNFRGAVVAFQEVTDIMRLSEQLNKSKELIASLSSELGTPSSRYTFNDLVCKDKKMLETVNLSKRAAKIDSTVLITGESGTGKEIIANAIHYASPRWNKAFIAVNCAAIPDSLIESELFGHTKGAFTGAASARPGKFELANGGTLFLDEIGDLSFNTQAKLLRVLQEREVERIGSNERLAIDVKILAATNKNLLEMAKLGRFREDLYYRLQVITVTLPALRQRKGDIPLLAEHVLRQVCTRYNRPIPIFERMTLDLLSEYAWPGNIRELQNVITRAVMICEGEVLRPRDFRFLFNRFDDSVKGDEEPLLSLPELERSTLLHALRKFGQTTAGKKAAAQALNISLGTLYNKIKLYRISASEE